LERKSQKDEVTAALEEALEFNTELIKLEVSYRDHFKYESSSEESSSDSESYKILNQTKVLLAQNRTIVELRQYVLDHPLINTVDIPTDVVNILDQQIIVSFLKSGQTKEATKKAIDEFLIIASTTALAKDSKLN
jgi:hypothetical protein